MQHYLIGSFADITKNSETKVQVLVSNKLYTLNTLLNCGLCYIFGGLLFLVY